MAVKLTVHWWDGFNRDHHLDFPIDKKAAETELKERIKRGAVRGELRAESGQRVLALERGDTGQVIQTFPSRKG